MFNFNLKKTEIYQAIKWARIPFFGRAKELKGIFLFLSFFCFLIFLLENNSFFIGFSIIFLMLGLGSWYTERFFNLKLKNPKLKITLEQAILSPEKYNLAEFLNYKAANAIWQATRFCKKRKLPKIPSEVILYFFLGNWIETCFIFSRASLNLKKIKKELKDYLDSLKGEGFQEVLSEDSQKVILEAIKIAQKKDKEYIGIGEVLISQSQIDPCFKKCLIEADIKTQDIENLADWCEKIEKRILETKEIWKYRNLMKKGSIAKDWAAGYSITLDKYAFDLRRMLEKTSFQEIVGHEKEIVRCEQILAKQEINNVLLVGESGTGRKSIVKAIAQKAFLGESSFRINYKRVLIFDLGQLTAEIACFEELETVLEECFKQVAEAGNIILVIEEIQNFLEENPKPGTINISGILSRFLPLPCFQIIALTTYQGLHSVLEKKPAFLNLFEKIEVTEISEKETLRLLEDFLPFFEKKYKRVVSYKALREILKLSSRYLTDLPFPEKAVRLLDEAMSWLSVSKKGKILKSEHITKIVSEKIQIPLEELEQKEKEILLNLEALIHQRIINQEEAVKEVSEAMRRAKAGIETRSGTIGGFLFLGPTGVGKTETAKALAAVYFGSEKRMIRLDMSEFQEIKDIKRLIGAEGSEGLLTTSVRENPFSLILLDEIEKAHPNILNLFLQVLDEGWITDGFGRKIDFKNAIIIATSNAGAEIIRQDIKENKKLSIVKDELLDYLFKKNIFRPEFINRFDGVVVFKPLTKENLILICHLMLKKLAENFQDKGIGFEITKELKEKVVDLSYSPQFGAREMKRTIQDKIENVLASALLSNEIKRGDRIEIDPADFKLKKQIILSTKQ